MSTLRSTLVSLSVVPAILVSLGCGGAGGAAAPAVSADMPPSVDCGRTIEVLAPVLETPAVVLVGEPRADVPRLVGDIACQVAAGGHQVVVAMEPDEADAAKADLAARVDNMRAAGLEVIVAKYKLATGVKRLAVERPDARLIVLGDNADAIREVPAYAINVVGDAARPAPAPELRANPEREGGFDAVLDLGVAAEPPAPAAPVTAVAPTPAG